jgi:segregation and condensation protein B
MSADEHQPPRENDSGSPLDLAGFRDVPDDQGMTLDNLSTAFAELLGRGDEPYETEGDSSPVASQADSIAPTETPTGAANEDDDACEVTPRSILEAMLFVGNPDGTPLSAVRVAGLMRGVRAAEIETFVAELNDEYASNGCPYHIASDAAGYRLELLPAFEATRAAVRGQNHAKRLSAAAVEVLSIVAYKGPLNGEAVGRLRGRPSGSLLAQLVRRQLLRVERGTGRNAKYAVTKRFLKLAGLASLEDLPRAHDLDLK